MASLSPNPGNSASTECLGPAPLPLFPQFRSSWHLPLLLNGSVALYSLWAHSFPTRRHAAARRLFLKHPSDPTTTCFCRFPLRSGWSHRSSESWLGLPCAPLLTAPASPPPTIPYSAFPSRSLRHQAWVSSTQECPAAVNPVLCLTQVIWDQTVEGLTQLSHVGMETTKSMSSGVRGTWVGARLYSLLTMTWTSGLTSPILSLPVCKTGLGALQGVTADVHGQLCAGPGTQGVPIGSSCFASSSSFFIVIVSHHHHCHPIPV